MSEVKYVLDKDGKEKLYFGEKIRVDDPERKKFYYDKDGCLNKYCEGDYNKFGEDASEVYGFNPEDWCNPCGDYSSYGSYGGMYN